MKSIPVIPITLKDFTLAVVILSKQRYPEATLHAFDIITSQEKEGFLTLYTIDRKGSKKNRRLSLRHTPPRKGFDRDEWPMAMFREGGEGADVRYISPSDNRGLGSYISKRLKDYPDGTKVLFVFV